jgi:uncharacterized delta-60 repeat protein
MAVIRALALLKTGGLISAGNVGAFYLKKLKSDGSSDNNFGVDGVVVDGAGTDAMAIAAQKDGKVIAVGYGGPMLATIARYNEDGSKDQTFGSSGSVYLNFDGYNVSKDLQILSTGKILISTYSSSWGQSDSPSINSIGIARLNQDGTLDETFGINGKVKIDSYIPYDWTFVRTQTNKKIVVSSTTTSGNGWDIFLSRLNSNGDIDLTYGSSGFAYVSVNGTQHGRSLNIDRDNNAYVAGSSQPLEINAGDIAYNVDVPRDFFVTKLTPQGLLDLSFGNGLGSVTVDLGGADTCQASTVQSDGKIILAGMSIIEGIDYLALLRLNKDGSIDATFGNNGKVLVSGLDSNALWFEVTDVELTSAGKIVAAFTTGSSSFAITFNSDGSVNKGYLLGTESNNYLVGTSSGDILFGLSGDDELIGGIGNDFLYGGEGNDVLNGGDGLDTVNYEVSESDLLINLQNGSASGVDIGIDALTGIEIIISGNGNDTLIGSNANEILNGNDGLDTVSFESSQSNLTIDLNKSSASGIDIGNDILIGIEKIVAGSGNDIITGLSGQSCELQGGAGDDKIFAGNNNDIIIGGHGAGNDQYHGGSGVDTVKYLSAEASISIDLTSGIAKSISENDVAKIGVDTLLQIENIIAGDFNDILIGDSLNNYLQGGLGDDSLNGMLGKDILIGGGGSDQFVFNTKILSSNFDKILDFECGVDKIILDDAIFSKLKGVDLTSNSFIYGAKALDSDDYLIFNPDNGYLYYDPNGSSIGGQKAFAQVTAGLALDALDFSII